MGLMVLVVTSATGSATGQQRSEGEEGILAVRLRQQGYRCDEPARAESDAARSRPDERAWVVMCANASYRMRLIPDLEHVQGSPIQAGIPD